MGLPASGRRMAGWSPRRGSRRRSAPAAPRCASPAPGPRRPGSRRARAPTAGLAEAGPPGGGWGVAVVATARRERDRELRARWHTGLGVLLAGGLVLAFGGAALRRQRRELELARELAISALQRQR